MISMVQAIISVKHFEIGAILLTGITNSVDSSVTTTTIRMMNLITLNYIVKYY